MAEIGSKHLHGEVSPDRNWVSFVGAIFADGTQLPPVLLFDNPGPSFVVAGGRYFAAPTAAFGRTEKGYMEKDMFLMCLKWWKENLPESRRDKPIVLLVDGHVTHVSLEAQLWCRAQNWHLVQFPSHCSHMMQPLDVNFFRSFKMYYRQILVMTSSVFFNAF